MFVITNGKVWVKETSGEFIEVKKCREASQYEKREICAGCFRKVE